MELASVAHDGAGYEHRAQLSALTAQIMRLILVDHARSRLAEQRGGGVPHVALEPVIIDKLGGSQSLLGLDDPLLSLEKWMRIIREDGDPRLAVCESLAGAGTELRSGVRSGG